MLTYEDFQAKANQLAQASATDQQANMVQHASDMLAQALYDLYRLANAAEVIAGTSRKPIFNPQPQR
jgi:coproporphyrinogen III oxidase-like Fe-S oxidoreductase